MVKNCQNCGAELKEGTIFCPSCGAKIEQQPMTTQPTQQFKRRARVEIFTPWLIIVGTMLIGIGIIILGFIPSDIYIETASLMSSYSGAEFHPELKITSLQLGAILIGIGTILEGLAGGLNVKAYFDLKKQSIQ